MPHVLCYVPPPIELLGLTSFPPFLNPDNFQTRLSPLSVSAAVGLWIILMGMNRTHWDRLVKNIEWETKILGGRRW